MTRCALLVLALLGVAKSAQADVVVEIANVSTIAGTTSVLVPVTVRGNSNLTGFNLPFDVGANGIGLPVGITFSSPAFNTAGATLPPALLTSNSAGAAALNADLLVNGGLILGTTTSTNQTVFNLVFDVASTAAPGTYAINFTATNAVEFNVSQAGGGAFTLANGSINVVPEPSGSLALLGVGCALLFRRRKVLID